jgi:hypothetical protein
VPHLWHEDASGRVVLRLRGLRLDQRLQLTPPPTTRETPMVERNLVLIVAGYEGDSTEAAEDFAALE